MSLRRALASLAFAALLLASIAACRDRTDQPPKPSEQDIVEITPDLAFKLKSGQKATLNVDEAIVSFVSVSEDSRCPSDVACAWAGQVTVVLRVVIKGEALGDTSLTLMAGQPASADVGGYALTLTAVDPYPVSTEPIKPVDYEATLTLSP